MKASKRRRNSYVEPQSIPPLIAQYVCLSCAHEWTEQKRGSPNPNGPTQCRRCGAIYVQWTNWNATAHIAHAMLDVELDEYKKQSAG